MSYAYHAHALALGARFDLPTPDTIPSVAAVSLPRTGGEAYATVRNFSYKGIISFDQATSYVAGSFHDDAYNTMAMVSIENLNILDMIYAARVVTRVSGRHTKNTPESEITFAGSGFEGLSIAGVPLRADFHHSLFANYPTFKKFEAMTGNDLGAMARDACWERSDKVQQKDGVISCTVLRSVKPDLAEPVAWQNGHVIHVHQFGTIYLGQVIMKPGYRRLSMIRVELGCPFVGVLEAGGGEGNGTETWP